jgi:hypothetical protein
MKWPRPWTKFPLVGVSVVVAFCHAAPAATQHQVPPEQTPPLAASAPTSQAADPAQSGIPEPTVVLKPGEVPGILFKQPTYDFGRTRSGTQVTHDFEFTNTGNGPLEVLQVKPG